MTSLLLLLALAVSATPSPVSVADLEFTPPADWVGKPSTSSMRVAQYTIPGKAGEAEAVVYYFGPGQGGSAADNVARWFGQFTPGEGAKDIQSSRDQREVGEAKVKVTVVRARGTYESGMPMGAKTPKTGQALYGVIIESPKGPVFVKLAGPAATVDAAAPGCEALVKSIRISAAK